MVVTRLLTSSLFFNALERKSEQNESRRKVRGEGGEGGKGGGEEASRALQMKKSSEVLREVSCPALASSSLTILSARSMIE